MKVRLLFLVSLIMHQTAPLGVTERPGTINPGSLNYRSDKNIRSQILAVQAALRNERYDQAISLCNVIFRSRLSNKVAALVYELRSSAYLDTDRIQEAMSDAESAIHIAPTSPSGYSARAYINDALGKHKLALADSNEAIRRDPTHGLAYSNRGVTYDKLGDVERALADYNEGIRLNPNTLADIFRYRANLYLKKHNYKAAFADLEAAVTRGKAQSIIDYRDALKSLAWALATCPDVAYRNGRRAVELSKKACDLTRWKSPRTIDILAAAYAECGDFDQAIKYQTQALATVDPPEPGLTEKEKTLATQERREHLVLYKNHNPCREDYQRRY